MSTNFPTTLDSSTTIPAEGASTVLATNHVTAHQNIQDAIEAIEAKIGVDSSAVTTSHDYKLSEVTSTDKAVGKTATQTLTNKTLTSPVINVGSDAEGDTYYRNSSGAFVRLPRGTDNYIYKMNGNVPNWEAETVISNATTTTAGIGELATSAEVTAGTATGGSGAPLIVTPDALAGSTPVFDGSALTNVGLYALSTDVLATYQTFQMPMVGASATTINGWNLVTVTQTVQNASMTKMGGSGSADFTAQSLLPGSGAQDSFRYNESKIIRIRFKAKLDDTTDRKGFGLAITPANIHTAQTDTTNGEIRFVWNGATLYAQNANGTATSTDISSGITGTNWNTYEIIFTPGVDAKFYVNGSLKATHTTNLPTTGTPGITFGANANGRTIATTFPIVSIQN